MCLSTVSARRPTKTGFGYKVFRPYFCGYRGEYFFLGYPIIPGQWNKASGADWTNPDYPFGFHIFLSRAAAQQWKGLREVVKRVEYRQAHTLGKQEQRDVDSNRSSLCVVAREMRIVPESKNATKRKKRVSSGR